MKYTRRSLYDLIGRFGVPLLLVAVFGIGIWFRFFHIFQSTWMLEGYDESRDMLVARHIVEYGDWIWRGPLASGSMNALMNSPMYYYVVSALWLIGRSPFSVMLLWAVMLTGTIYIAYRIGAEAGDKQLGVIMALLFAVQPTLISNSRHMSQPYILPLFSALFLWLFWKKTPMTLVRFCLLIVLLLFPMHIHYGSLLMLPAGFFWLGTVWVEGIVRKHEGLSWKIVPALVVEYFLIMWVWLTYGQAPFDQQFYLVGNMQRTWASVTSQVQAAWLAAADNVWWSKDPVIVLSTLIFFAGCTLWLQRRRPAQKNPWIRSYGWMVGFAITPLLVAAFHRDIIYPHYMLSTLPVLLFIIASGLRAILASNRYVGLVCIGIVLWIFIEQAATVVREVPARAYYQQFQDISKALHADYRLRGQDTGREPDIALAVLAGKNLPYDGWGTGALWYFLEDYFGKRLVFLDNYGVNFVPIVSRASYFYVLCDNRGYVSGSENMCTRNFRAARTYLLDRKEEKIYAAGPFVLWLFRTDPNLPVSTYNLVYPGL